MRDMVIASDALLSVNAINRLEKDYSYFGTVINDCRQLFIQLDSVFVEYNHRDSNVSVHNLAKVAVMLPEYHIWGGPYDFLLASVFILC